MVRSSPLRTSEDESALSMSSTGSEEADTLGLLRIMSKYIAFVSVPTKTQVNIFNRHEYVRNINKYDTRYNVCFIKYS